MHKRRNPPPEVTDEDVVGSRCISAAPCPASRPSRLSCPRGTGPVPAETAAELKERIDAERQGAPFLVYRDAAGRQLIHGLGGRRTRLNVGRSDAADLSLDFDPEVSRVHAELERVGEEWALADDGLSRNGSFVNGERVVGRRRLRDGDALQFGETGAVSCPVAGRGG